MTPDLVTVGGLTVDNVVAADGTVALAQAGGNAAYSAAGALLWCDQVGLVARVPASYPQAALDRLVAHGVDAAGVVRVGTIIDRANWFLYDAAGRRTEGIEARPEALAEAGFPTNKLSPAEAAAWAAVLAAQTDPSGTGQRSFRAENPIRAEQVPPAFLRARGVHLAPSQPEVMAALLDRFAPHGPIITADPGWQLAEQPLDRLVPILSRISAFLPSEVEAQALVPGAAPAGALAHLAERCPGVVAIKLGAAGVLVWDRGADAPIHVPAAPAAALDPTGAGDAFCGGFLAGLLETGDPVHAARFGALSAARIVEAFGADGALPHDRAAARAALQTTLVQ